MPASTLNQRPGKPAPVTCNQMVMMVFISHFKQLSGHGRPPFLPTQMTTPILETET